MLEAQFVWNALKYLNSQKRPGNLARTVFPFNFLVLPVFSQFSGMNPLSKKKKLCLLRRLFSIQLSSSRIREIVICLLHGGLKSSSYWPDDVL